MIRSCAFSCGSFRQGGTGADSGSHCSIAFQVDPAGSVMWQCWPVQHCTSLKYYTHSISVMLIVLCVEYRGRSRILKGGVLFSWRNWPRPLLTNYCCLETMMKYYDDKQIQRLRENNSLIHLSSGVYYTTQASIHPSTDTRKPVPGCLSSPHAAVQMHTVVHTPRLGTYSWLRAARCPPCVPALSWLSPSTEDPSLAAQLAQPLALQPCMQQENYCQVSNTMSAKNYFPWQQLVDL